jgi:hypothetical protein
MIHKIQQALVKHPGACCWYATACLIEENTCVECIEESICGWGKHCNLETNTCESGFPDGGLFGGFGGILLALVGAFAGFMFMGPCGALIFGLLGLFLGGGLLGGGG